MPFTACFGFYFLCRLPYSRWHGEREYRRTGCVPKCSPETRHPRWRNSRLVRVWCGCINPEWACQYFSNTRRAATERWLEGHYDRPGYKRNKHSRGCVFPYCKPLSEQPTYKSTSYVGCEGIPWVDELRLVGVLMLPWNLPSWYG